MTEVWAVGDAYESYVGRWSRQVAPEFLDWLGAPPGLRWVDAGCGTGALTEAVLAMADPVSITGIDPSQGFLTTAADRVIDPRASFQPGDAQALPLPDRDADVVVGGLMLNFVPDATRAAAEFARVLTPGGTAAAYVWDYADGMQMMRYFWDAAAHLDAEAAALDEGRRFPLCRPEPLRALWTGAGLRDVTVRAIEVPTVFADFDDDWRPFLGGQAPAPAYAMSLPEPRRDRLRELIRHRLPASPDGSIALIARAWAVRGTA